MSSVSAASTFVTSSGIGWFISLHQILKCTRNRLFKASSTSRRPRRARSKFVPVNIYPRTWLLVTVMIPLVAISIIMRYMIKLFSSLNCILLAILPSLLLLALFFSLSSLFTFICSIFWYIGSIILLVGLHLTVVPKDNMAAPVLFSCYANQSCTCCVQYLYTVVQYLYIVCIGLHFHSMYKYDAHPGLTRVRQDACERNAG